MSYLIEFIIGLSIGLFITALTILAIEVHKRHQHASVVEDLFNHETSPRFSRKRIIEEVLRIDNVNITIKIRNDQPELPASLNYMKRTFAMLHGTDHGVVMIVKISDHCAHELSKYHPHVRKSLFPRGANWYYIPIDDSFETEDEVFNILYKAMNFISSMATSTAITSKEDTKTSTTMVKQS
jgi:predicted DNA-binding protein (MmcQ/YjbR family)